MIKKSGIKLAIVAAFAGSLVAIANTASASGFQLFEQNAVNMGDAGAGGAAIAEDASTAYYNPAGLVRITHQQIVLSGDEVMSNGEFKGTNTWQSTLDSTPPQTYTQTGSAQGGTSNFVPAFHYALPLNNQWFFGFSAAVPFGLSTDYSNSSIVRYSATFTQLKTLDLSPSLAYKIDDKFSIGAGIDFEKVNAELDAVAGLPYFPIIHTYYGTSMDTLSKNEADDWGYGWHAGMLYQLDPATRVGLAYHSRVNFDLTGSSRLSGPLAGLVSGSNGVLRSNQLSGHLTLPPTTTLSAYHDINNQWAIDSSINYTQWTIFNKALGLQNVQSVAIEGGIPQSALIDTSIPQNFHNSWRFAVGTQYRPCDQWTLRAGAGYDESPVSDNYRNVRLPDANRYIASLGAHYQALKTLGLDLGYSHFFFQHVNVSTPLVTGSQISTSTGRFNNTYANLIGGQITWDIN